jgi:GNAT superfamily N-acetyltransferase
MTIAIRRAAPQDANAIAQVRIDSWRTTYRGLVPDAYLDAMQLGASVEMWSRVLNAADASASVFVAENDGSIVGFAAGNLLKEPRYGLNAELSAVYLRREFQRAGLGRRLVCAVAEAARGHGAAGMIVWIISGNRAARAFCERLGATLLVEQPFEWDGVPLTEAGYAFTDIDALVAACKAVSGTAGQAMH